MIKYHTDKFGRYNGENSEARINPNYNPETHQIDDKYVYNPRTESLMEPLATGENEACRLIENADKIGNWMWVVITDRIGQHYYEQDGTRFDIEALDIDFPPGSIQEDPPTVYHDTHNGSSWIEDTDKRDMAVWEAEMASTDKDMPRHMENLYNSNPSLIRDSWTEEKFQYKKQKRNDKPVK